MKNILFCGPYLTESGWGYAANSYLEALLLTDNNVVARPTYLSNEGPIKPSKKILQAQDKRLDNIDVVIQNVLPDCFEHHDAYNIGIIHTETRGCNPLWVNKINLLDELWVNSQMERASLMLNGVDCKINVVPTPANLTKLDKYYKTVEPLDIPEIEGKYVFYFIGALNDRKNLMAFIQAFHREFATYEQVSILIKTNGPGLKDAINGWKQSSRTRATYIPEILIEGPIEEKTIYSIHKSCDCFVATSRGESHMLPIMDALYFNNPVLCTNNIFASSVFGDRLFKVKSYSIPVNTINPPLSHIYTGNETWEEIDILDLQKNMRNVFENKFRNNLQEDIKQNFSLEEIGKQINNILECVKN